MVNYWMLGYIILCLWVATFLMCIGFGKFAAGESWGFCFKLSLGVWGGCLVIGLLVYFGGLIAQL